MQYPIVNPPSYPNNYTLNQSIIIEPINGTQQFVVYSKEPYIWQLAALSHGCGEFVTGEYLGEV